MIMTTIIINQIIWPEADRKPASRKRKQNPSSFWCLVRVRSYQVCFSSFLGRPLLDDDFFFTAFFLALFFTRLFRPTWSGRRSVARTLVASATAATASTARAPGVVGGRNLGLIVRVEQREQVAEFLLLRVVAHLLHLLESLLHALVSEHFDLSLLLLLATFHFAQGTSWLIIYLKML